LGGKSPSAPKDVPAHDWVEPEKPDNWPSWGKVWTREHFEKEDMWNKEWDTGGKHAPRRCRDNVARGSSPPPKAKEESSSLDNLSPRHDRDDDPFDDPPKAKYRSVGVITSGGGANYKPKRSRKKLAPDSPKPLRSDSESDSDSSESEDGKDNDPPPARKDPPPDDEEPPRRKVTQAPWRPIRSPSKRSALKKDNDEKREQRDNDTKSQEGLIMTPSPRYNQGEIVYYWSAEKKEYWVGVIRRLRYPTCKNEKITTYRYEIEPEGVSLTTSVPCVLIPQRDVRPLKWAIAHICPSCGPTGKNECTWRVNNNEKRVPELSPQRHQH